MTCLLVGWLNSASLIWAVMFWVPKDQDDVRDRRIAIMTMLAGAFVAYGVTAYIAWLLVVTRSHAQSYVLLRADDLATNTINVVWYGALAIASLAAGAFLWKGIQWYGKPVASAVIRKIRPGVGGTSVI